MDSTPEERLAHDANVDVHDVTDWLKENITDEDRAEARWLARRRKSVGASEAQRIFDCPYTVWREKRGLIEPEPPNNFTFCGHHIQDAIIKMYRTTTGRVVRSLGKHAIQAREAEYAYMHATLDGWVLPKSDEGHSLGGPLEVKNHSGWRSKEWVDDGMPEAVYKQIQAQIACTGAAWGSVAVLVGGHDFRWFDVERDDECIRKIAERAFYIMKCVKNQEPPEPGAKDIIRQLREDEDVSTIKLEDADTWELTSEFDSLQAEKKRVMRRQNEIRNHFKLRLNNRGASRAYVQDGGYWVWTKAGLRRRKGAQT